MEYKVKQMSNLRRFIIPEVVFGQGSRFLTGKFCSNFDVNKVLIVTDKGIIDKFWFKEICSSIEDSDIQFTVFSDVFPNPRDFQVMNGVKAYNENKCEAIVAVGGGSPMDCAKGIGIVAMNQGHILDYEGVNQIEKPLPPMIFIPSTAGTSSDVSQFTIISDTTRKVKIAIISKIIIPDVALIDPETTETKGRFLTACTGMDALVHAMEAYVSIANSKLTDVHALEAIKYIFRDLPELLKNPDNKQLREKIMYASMEAGFAFSNAILGAVHAMAHSLGGLMDLPHGLCNSLLLEHVIGANYVAVPNRYKTIASEIGVDYVGKDREYPKQKLIEKTIDLRISVGIDTNLSKVGVNEELIPRLAEFAHNDACLLTNPRKLTVEELGELYVQAL